MDLPISLSVSDVQKIASSGSPAILDMAGRAVGLGDAERTALSAGNVPAWFWITTGLLVGVVVGVRVHRNWPKYVPNAVKGR